jgi:anion-transporting  ArsA/GET3 family ATPase
MSQIGELLHQKRVLVCCGAGGVGKTTVSASLALAAARQGRRVLVVTIDPSKRLAETLGVSRNPEEPVAISADRLESAGVTGALSAWMLDPQLVADKVVNSFSTSASEATQLLQNRIYQNVTAMVAGMQEYTAVEALYEFVENDAYDLIILDTPPSRDALRFLDAPGRATAFLDKRIFNLFIPGEGGLIRRMATKLVEKVMDMTFGEVTRRELQQFMALFGKLLGYLNQNQSEMKAFFAGDQVGFVLVTSPASEAVKEAKFFARRAVDDLGLNLNGYVLNRSLASETTCDFPSNDAATGPLATALSKLRPFADTERRRGEAHRELASEVAATAGEGVWTCILPNLGGDASQLQGLVSLADALVEDHNLATAKTQETHP